MRIRLLCLALLTSFWCAPIHAADEPSSERARRGDGVQPSPDAGKTDKTAAKSDEKSESKEEKDPVLSVTDHQITIGGQVIKYRATAGYLVLRDAKTMKPKANLFFVAYTKLDSDNDTVDLAKRPVTFSFNGGPGSASIWLHMGALGPKRVLMTAKGESLPPPYRMVDNEYCWLDQTDLVFIDPVTTGYSREVKGEDPAQFHGFDGDIHSVGDFIRLYTTRYHRWPSPKFLIGESYGTTRASALSDYLQDEYGIYLNGITLVSSVMNFQTLRFARGNDLPYELFLPTYAAAAWYHKKLGAPWTDADLPTVLHAAEKFVTDKYTPALDAGDALPPNEKAALAKQMSALIGIPEKLVAQRDLRIDIFTFANDLLEDENRLIGRYDSRLTGIRYEPGPSGGQEFDPSYEAVYGAYTACFNDYVRCELKYETDMNYNVLTDQVRPWNFSNVENQYLNTAEMLHKAMTRNTNLKVWIANGHFDLATPYFATEYTVDHMGLDPAVRGNISLTFYEAGHMIYMVPSELAKLKADAVKFYQSTLHAAGVQ